MKHKKAVPFYPLLFAIFPVVSLLGHNIQEVYPAVSYRSFLFMLVLTIGYFLVARLISRTWQKSALLTLVFLVFWYAYGRIDQFLISSLSSLSNAHPARLLLIFWAVLFVIISVLIILKVKTSNTVTIILNSISIFLLVSPIFQISSYYLRTSQAAKQPAAAHQTSTTLIPPQSLPDVYIIILDSHLRSDVLWETFQYDNQPFIDQLTDMGFYVASCSMSNYAYTPLSLSSTLNMSYLESLSVEFTPPNTDRTGLFELVKHNAIRANLEQLGYKSVSMVSYQPLKWDDASGYIPTDAIALDAISDSNALNSFERMLTSTTLMKVFINQIMPEGSNSAVPADYPYAEDVRQQLFILENLKEIASSRGPKLVFVHINIPHPPYIFNADGSLIQNPPPLPWVVPLPWEQYLQYYPNHVAFIDSEITPILQQIINQAQTPPVIVLQGDHGADSVNRLAILNAYYVPQQVREYLYPSISPVNSFRLIFNGIFNANYPLLEDHSYLSTQTEIYQFTPYPETLPACQPR